MRKFTTNCLFHFQTSRYNTINLSAPSTFYAKDLTIQKNLKLKDLPTFDAKNLGFGLNSTDHMVSMNYDKVTKWEKP